jgi:hypothetical protein
MQKEFCKGCGKFHIPLIKITKEEAESFLFLNNRLFISSQYVRSSNRQAVIDAALKLNIDTRHMMDMWWHEIGAKYKIDIVKTEFNVDAENNFLYVKGE